LNFFKKRAAIEEEYARQLTRLSQSMLESHDRQQFAPDTLTHAWSSILRIHESIGDQRQKFSAEISEVAEDIAYLVKDIEKKRKMVKHQGWFAIVVTIWSNSVLPCFH
jgi:dGTP triphosphohydrolase